MSSAERKNFSAYIIPLYAKDLEVAIQQVEGSEKTLEELEAQRSDIVIATSGTVYKILLYSTGGAQELQESYMTSHGVEKRLISLYMPKGHSNPVEGKFPEIIGD